MEEKEFTKSIEKTSTVKKIVIPPTNFSTVYGRGINNGAIQRIPTPSVKVVNGKNLIPRSSEVHEILSYVPNWMILWGNTVIFLILAGIISMSYFIKYPDVATGNIILNSAYPPIPLVAKKAGSIRFFKGDKAQVKEDEIIGILKNEANYEDVQTLRKEVHLLQEKLEKEWRLTYYQLPTGLQLGTLQSAYSNLYLKLKEHKIQQKSNTNTSIRQQNIDQQLQELIIIKKAKEQSLSLKYQEYLKAKQILAIRHKKLHQNGSISTEELEVQESAVQQLLDIYQNDRISFNEIKKRMLELSGNKVELDFQEENQNVLRSSALTVAVDNLNSSIHDWEQTYLLKTPITGTLNFSQFIKDNMYIRQEQEIAQIIPEQILADSSLSIIGELMIPARGAGKVMVGQSVNIALFDFPKKEFGTLEGKVKDISNISSTLPDSQGMSFYKVTVSFPKGMESTMQKEVQFKHNMQGNAEIITADIRLIERFFYELREIVK